MYPVNVKRISPLIFLFVNLFLLFVSQSNAQVIAKVGTYTGNGVENRELPVLNFKPDFLLIKCENKTAQIALSGFPSNKTKEIDGGGLKSDVIISLDTDGFTVGKGNEVNKNGDLYQYLAIKAQAGLTEIGQYTGNGTDNRNIGGISFQPALLFIVSSGNNEKPVFTSSTMGGDKTMDFVNSHFEDDQIQSLNQGGFQVGKDKAVNENGVVYHYIAFKSAPGSLGLSSYTGNGSNNRAINGAGAGNFTLIKSEGENAVFSSTNMATDKSYYFKKSGLVSGRIKSYSTEGVVVGNQDEVNKNGKVYHIIELSSFYTVLPVKWLSFTGLVKSSQNLLSWSTTAETANDFFVVERSSDGANFVDIGQTKGNGTTANTSSYQFADEKPLAGISYYRLRQIDIHGAFSYSIIVKLVRSNSSEVSTSSDGDFRIFPNPLTGNRVYVDQTVISANIDVAILTSNGRLIATTTLKNGDHTLNLPENMPVGNYIVTGSSNGKKIFSKQIVKMR